MKRGNLAIFLIFLTANLLFIACDNSVTPSTFEESIDMVVGLNPVSGTENSTIKVSQGEDMGMDSWFVFEIDQMQPNGFVENGVVEGWCVEWTKAVESNGTAHKNNMSYSTFGKEKWKPLNFFLSIKDQLKVEDPNLTFKEMQAVIWSLVAEPKFDLNTLKNEELPKRLKDRNGNPDFSKTKVLQIVDRVLSNLDSFEYDQNKPSATMHDLGNDKQVIITFRTQTQGGWGAPAAGNNPGAYRDANFAFAFPNGLIVGGANTLTLTSASAVEAFLPAGGPPSSLTGNFTDPVGGNGTGGVFSGQVVALTLSVTFDEFDPNFAFNNNTDCLLKDLIIQKGPFTGWTVQQVLDEANKVLGGTSGTFTVQQLNDIVDAINNNFVDGNFIADSDLLAKP